MGIVRTGRVLQSEYAEWLASKYLSLQLAESTIQQDYDATDSMGHTYQIKSRTVDNLSNTTAFHFGNSIPSFDYLICVFLSPQMKLLGIVEVPHEVGAQLSRKNQRGFRFRWNKSVANNPKVKKLFGF